LTAHASHVAEVVAPTAVENVSAGHLRQLPAPARCSGGAELGRYVPATHGTHAVPASGWFACVPAAHMAHTAASATPVSLCTRPDGHGRHAAPFARSVVPAE
jgi:hypothetical protein